MPVLNVPMKKMGWALLGVGFLLILVGIFYDATVGDNDYERTYNMGKMQAQIMIWDLGIGLLICGTFAAVVGTVVERLEDAGFLPKIAYVPHVQEQSGRMKAHLLGENSDGSIGAKSDSVR